MLPRTPTGLRMVTLATAILDFYATLDLAGFAGLRPGGARPPLSQTLVPQTTAQGTQRDLDAGPFVTFELRANNEEQGFESDIETHTLTFTAYAAGAQDTPDTVGAAASQQVIRAIRYNNQGSQAGAGYANRATLPTLTDGTLIGIFPTRPPATTQLRGTTKAGFPAFSTVMEYRVQVERA